MFNKEFFEKKFPTLPKNDRNVRKMKDFICVSSLLIVFINSQVIQIWGMENMLKNYRLKNGMSMYFCDLVFNDW